MAQAWALVQQPQTPHTLASPPRRCQEALSAVLSCKAQKSHNVVCAGVLDVRAHIRWAQTWGLERPETPQGT